MWYDTNKFIRRNITRFMIFAIALTVVGVVYNTPIFANEMAMLQMENDNALYLQYEMYNNIKNLISSFALALAIGAYVGYTLTDFRFYFKHRGYIDD